MAEDLITQAKQLKEKQKNLRASFQVNREELRALRDQAKQFVTNADTQLAEMDRQIASMPAS